MTKKNVIRNTLTALALASTSAFTYAVDLDSDTVPLTYTSPANATISNLTTTKTATITTGSPTGLSANSEPGFDSGDIPFDLSANTAVEVTVSTVDGFTLSGTPVSTGNDRTLVYIASKGSASKSYTASYAAGSHAINLGIRHQFPAGATSAAAITAGTYSATLTITVATPSV